MVALHQWCEVRAQVCLLCPIYETASQNSIIFRQCVWTKGCMHLEMLSILCFPFGFDCNQKLLIIHWIVAVPWNMKMMYCSSVKSRKSKCKLPVDWMYRLNLPLVYAPVWTPHDHKEYSRSIAMRPVLANWSEGSLAPFGFQLEMHTNRAHQPYRKLYQRQW